MTIVEIIKSLCDTRGTSIPRLEKDLGFGRGSIYNWEKSSPSIDKIEKVANYFNVSINRVLYGFDADRFSNLTNIAKGDRTIAQFSVDTGVDHHEIIRICLGYAYERPSLETVKKIASNNKYSLLFSEDDFLEAAGYISERQVHSARIRAAEELIEQYANSGIVVERDIDDDFSDLFHISRKDGTAIASLFLDEFLTRGLDLLDEYTSKLEIEIQTLAAHHDGEDWTKDELQDIEEFKEVLRLKRQLKKNRE
ncbi:helix-turn-helix transcriptional regulator [Paenibacillus kribbensis]|uniref:helix-turn-helix domain-containing protein n=1 Tax=Paenibacillus kribbensis TaxID=172713 RepID=UPI002DBDC6E0|nr:helix-turn-helix transcriptional regulator [Paenibacillus kribbensis]MEC0234425.1 helix-turn-helix transcriptional regulator [Paenibacillus kribbensis]